MKTCAPDPNLEEHPWILENFWKSLLFFDAWFWRYMWCSRALGHFIVCLRCLILTLFVVAGSTFGGHCFSSMLDFDAICRGMSLAASMPTTIGLTRSVTHEFWKIIACLRCLIKTDCTFEWRKENEPTSRHNSWVGLDFRFYFVGFEWVWMFYFLFLDCLILDSWFFVCLEFWFFGC